MRFTTSLYRRHGRTHPRDGIHDGRRIVDAAIDGIEFRDLSPEYFQLSPIPRDWYEDETASITELGDRGEYEDVLTAFGDYLSAHADDSPRLYRLRDRSRLDGRRRHRVERRGDGDEGAQEGGLRVGRAHPRVGEHRLDHRPRVRRADGRGGRHLQFTWESGGSQRARTMFVREFRGVLSRLESENIVRFETEIHEGGFDISDVRKIR